MRVRDCSDFWRAFFMRSHHWYKLRIALDQHDIGGGEFRCGVPLLGKPMESLLAPKADVSGVLDIVPL